MYFLDSSPKFIEKSNSQKKKTNCSISFASTCSSLFTSPAFRSHQDAPSATRIFRSTRSCTETPWGRPEKKRSEIQRQKNPCLASKIKKHDALYVLLEHNQSWKKHDNFRWYCVRGDDDLPMATCFFYRSVLELIRCVFWINCVGMSFPLTVLEIEGGSLT